MIRNLLNLEASDQSVDYLETKQQFQLHNLLTEQRHPKTWNLSYDIQSNTMIGITSLLSVDEDITKKFQILSEDISLLEQASESVKNAILTGKKVYIYGCGATGRLAKQIESSFWRPFWKNVFLNDAIKNKLSVINAFNNIQDRCIGEMTGADRALISSLEGFEDLLLIGKLQLNDHNIEHGDIIIGVTEGGETSSVIGTVLEGLRIYTEYNTNMSNDTMSNNDNNNTSSSSCAPYDIKKHLYFIYNNPDHVLQHLDRSAMILNNPLITKINLTTGPQSITGSTRMQATTSETYVTGIILEHAICHVLHQFLTEDECLAIGMNIHISLQERLLQFEDIQKAIASSAQVISQLTDIESAIYNARREPSVAKNTSSNNAGAGAGAGASIPDGVASNDFGHVTYYTQSCLITVFTDVTERSPTFRLFPLDTNNYLLERKSWVQIWCDSQSQADSWLCMLGRPFKGMDPSYYLPSFEKDISDVYLRATALRSLQNAANDQQYLYDFSVSPSNLQHRKPQGSDLCVVILLQHELTDVMVENSTVNILLREICNHHKEDSSESGSGNSGNGNSYVTNNVQFCFILVVDALMSPSDPLLRYLQSNQFGYNSTTPHHSSDSDIPPVPPHPSSGIPPLVVQLVIPSTFDPLYIRQSIGVKMLLNAHSTGVMSKIGRVVGNTMTSVNPGNLKLIGRATNLILLHVTENIQHVLTKRNAMNSNVTSGDGEQDSILLTYEDCNLLLYNCIAYCQLKNMYGKNSEVSLCVIRVLETFRRLAHVTWEDSEAILWDVGLEKYLTNYRK